jgi:phosphoglycerol transferase MdoB-like AlkP superfamily enzyme
MKAPFFTVLFTLTSHQPYLVPDSEKEMFPEQPEHPILKSISYSDQALKDFFELAKTQAWYNQTLFILVADHTGPVVFENQKNPLVQYQIPIVFFHPQITSWPKEIDTSTLAQQVDLPATLFDLLGMSESKTTLFGRSLLKTGPRNWTIFNGGNTYFTDGKKILIEAGRSLTTLDTQSLKSQEPSHDAIEMLKANQQVFSEAMWGNQLFQ